MTPREIRRAERLGAVLGVVVLVLILAGIVWAVVTVHQSLAPRIEEDMPGWVCSEMGNRVCGGDL